MTLEEKGPFRPVPVLPPLLQPVSQAIQGWSGVTAATHWDLYRVGEVVDGADFYVGPEELGHIHLNGEVHLAASPVLRHALLDLQLARPFPYGGAAYRNWVEFSIHSVADVGHATWMFHLNYQRLCGRPEAELLAEIHHRGLPR